MATITPGARRLFLILGLAYLIGAISVFLFAESLATLPAAARANNPWPWPIGPLALRFLAALGVSGTLTALFTYWRPDIPTVRGSVTLHVIITAFLLLHVLFHVGDLDWGKPLAAFWVAAVVLGFAASVLAAIVVYRAPLDLSLLPPTPVFAQAVNVFIPILTGLVGGTMFFLPSVGQERWPWDLANAVNVRLLGAIFLTVAVSAVWVWRQRSWYGYDLQYASAGAFAVVALIATFMHWNLFAARPVASTAFVAVYVLGAILGFYPFVRYALRQHHEAGGGVRVEAESSV